MNDYISLEELKAMTGDHLYERWAEAKFPFDLAGCSACVTQHKYFPGCCSHIDFSAQAASLKVALKPRPQELRTNLAEIYALRMFHRDLYPSTPEPPVHGETVPLQGKQGEPAEPARRLTGGEPRVLAAK